MWEKITPPAEKPANPYLLHFVVVETLLTTSCGFSRFLSFPTPQNVGYEWRSKGLTGFGQRLRGWDAPRRKYGDMWYFDPGGEGLSADDVTLYATGFLNFTP